MNPSSKYSLDPIRPLLNLQKNSSGRADGELLVERGPYPGVETPDQPGEPGEVDVGDVVGGFGGGNI